MSSENTLRTLKDLKHKLMMYGNEEAICYELKSEAVKYAKKFNREINYAKSTKKIDRLTYGLEFLKHFYNLEEEDLK